MENDETQNEALNKIETMLNGDAKKPKKRGFFSRRTPQVKEETKIRVKTIMDIPPLVNARRNVGNNEIIKGAIQGKKEAQKDIERYYNISLDSNLPVLVSIKNAMSNKDFQLRSETVVDHEMFELDTAKLPNTEEQDMKLMTLKKFSVYVFEVYLPAMYAQTEQIEGSKLVSLLTDVYNYMDLKKLYYLDK